MDWMLLIYTLPSHPSRKRAYVWRELKKLGAVYLRDGVALLPERETLREHLSRIAGRIVEEDGTCELAVRPEFLQRSDEDLKQRFQEERLLEYRELHHACVRFLRDVLEEVDADDFGFPDVENLDGELGRLHRWFEQVQSRDYFQASGADRVGETLDKCDRAFERFSNEASESDEAQEQREQDDVFERLGAGGERQGSTDELPL